MIKPLFAVAVLAVSTSALAAEYEIDPAHTYPNFAISHLGFSTMHGRFGNTSGTLTMDREAGTGAVDIVIDASSIDTGHEKRDEHLSSPDFLNAVEFPEITYKSTNVSFDGEDKATVEGELTILGETKPVTLNVDSIVCGTHPMNQKELCGFNATAQIKRSDFGMDYGLPAIGDEMQLTFQVEAYQK